MLGARTRGPVPGHCRPSTTLTDARSPARRPTEWPYRPVTRFETEGDAGANRYEALIRLFSAAGPDVLPLRRCLSAFRAASSSDRLRTPVVGSGRLSASTCHALTADRSSLERDLGDGVDPLPDIGPQ